MGYHGWALERTNQMSVQTKDSIALGMREAETHQLRAAVKELREELEHVRLRFTMYNIALKRIASYDGKHNLKDIAEDTIRGYGDD